MSKPWSRKKLFWAGIAIIVLSSLSFGLDVSEAPVRLSKLLSVLPQAAIGLALIGQSRGQRWTGNVATCVFLAVSAFWIIQAAAALARHDATGPVLVMGILGMGLLALFAYSWLFKRTMNLYPPLPH